MLSQLCISQHSFLTDVRYAYDFSLSFYSPKASQTVSVYSSLITTIKGEWVVFSTTHSRVFILSFLRPYQSVPQIME